MFARIARFITWHSGKVLIVSALLLGFAGWFGSGVFDHLSRGGFFEEGAESARVDTLLEERFRSNSPSVILLLRAKPGQTVDDPGFRQGEQAIAQTLKPHATAVDSYASTGSAAFVSQDRHSAFVTATLKGTDEQQEQTLDKLRPELNHPGVQSVQAGGPVAINLDVSTQIEEDLALAERVSFSVLAILLIVVFGSVVAGMLPLLLGVFAIIGAFALTRLLAMATDMSQYAINVIILLGLGLAVDYSLFVVSRFREELRQGRTVTQAAQTTVQTAGRTVFFSGLVVMASLLAMLVFPLGFLQSMALGGSAAVLAAMAGGLFVMPALLHKLGRRVNWLSFGRTRREAKERGDERQSIWYKTGRLFMARPGITLAVTLGLLLVAGSPFVRAHLINAADYRSLPQGSQSRAVSESLVQDFGYRPDSIKVLYEAPGLPNQASLEALSEYVGKLQELPGVQGVESIASPAGQGAAVRTHQTVVLSVNPSGTSSSESRLETKDDTGDADKSNQSGVHSATQALLVQRVSGDTTVIDVRYAGRPDSDQAQQLVRDIRALPPPDNASILVGGEPAVHYDLLATLERYTPYGLAVIVAVMFVVFFLMLGSLVIPLKAIISNILSLSVAYGALVWVFQDGHLTEALNMTPLGGLDAIVPILIFSIAFGLSMDYSVFLYSRIKEEYDRNGGNNTRAVLTGLQKTGGIITSASILLVVVVLAFAAGKIPLMQQLGLGLALTVLVDAFLVRMVLVPVTMQILGRWNWWAPEPLKRLQARVGLAER